MVMRLLAALVLSALFSGTLFAAEFVAEVDRKELYVNEHVLLTLSLSDSEARLRAEGVAPTVDLTVLSRNFDLGTPQADFRFNVNRNRGRATSTLTVALFPRAPGKFRIPSFGIDGVSTAPIELHVLPLADDAAPEVFARSGVVRQRSTSVNRHCSIWICITASTSPAPASAARSIRAPDSPSKRMRCRR